MKLSEELLDQIDGAEESVGADSRLTRWADMARALEASQLPKGLTVSCGSDGAWLHFDNGRGQKASLNVAAVAQRSGYVICPAVEGWVERFAAEMPETNSASISSKSAAAPETPRKGATISAETVEMTTAYHAPPCAHAVIQSDGYGQRWCAHCGAETAK
jgi:hypothetical protein